MSDRCATCGISLPERAPQSPEVRHCQDHWWREQLRRFDAGEAIDRGVADWFVTPRTEHTRAEFRGVRA